MANDTEKVTPQNFHSMISKYALKLEAEQGIPAMQTVQDIIYNQKLSHNGLEIEILSKFGEAFFDDSIHSNPLTKS